MFYVILNDSRHKSKHDVRIKADIIFVLLAEVEVEDDRT